MSTHPTAAKLLDKINDRKALVGVIGLGYVGLPLALAFAEKGFRVLGFDTDPEKVEKLNSGDCYIRHLDPTRLARAIGKAHPSVISTEGAEAPSPPVISTEGAERPSGEIWAGGNDDASDNPVLLEATSDFSRLSEPDAILICVPTPLGPHKEPDLRYVEASARAIADALRPGQLVILESTTYPGTTEDLLLPILEGTNSVISTEGAKDPSLSVISTEGAKDPSLSVISTEGAKRPSGEIWAGGAEPVSMKCGEDFFLAFSPEREDPGNPDYGTTNVPKVVGGADVLSGDLAQALYDQVIDSTVRVSSARVAEATKLTENIFRSVNIALVNELKVIYDKLGIDVWEVLDAAETKPFGFMRFNPGPGLGGHCILGNEWLRVRGCGLSGVYRAQDLFQDISRRFPAAVTKKGIFVAPEGLEALALDAKSGSVDWFPVSTLYRGRYEGAGRQVTTEDKRRLIVTSEHPMLVLRDEAIHTVAAQDLGTGDTLPLVSDLGDPCDNPVIDLIDVVPRDQRHRVWVRIGGVHWTAHSPTLKRRFGWKIRDSIRNDSLRLDRFLEIEPALKVSRESLVLMTGRGTARREWPARLEVTPDWARFVGYYLAEGCITIGRNAARVRLTFNRDESEYIEDARSILDRHGFPTSTYDDAAWHSTTIKASSLLLVWLLDVCWKCGRRSEDMKVPDAIFGLSPEHKKQLLSGLLRGDGDVWVRAGKRTYTKNGRQYAHHDATAQVGYFSSSEILLEQVLHLMQDLGFQPGFKKRQCHIRLHGRKTIDKLIPFFEGDKRKKLERVQAARRRSVASRSDLPPVAPGVRSTVVKSVDTAIIDGWVYSMEVEGARAFTTSSGIGIHNCIPLDPFYLAWRAREAGVPTRFIELAGEINTSMPGYVIDKLQAALNERGKALKGSKILILGLAYKPDIDDPRESPAFEIIDRLLLLGAEVNYHDPHIPVAPKMRSWPDLPAMESVELNAESLETIDGAILVTDHDGVDYGLVIDNSPVVIDTRGVFERNHENVTKA